MLKKVIFYSHKCWHLHLFVMCWKFLNGTGVVQGKHYVELISLLFLFAEGGGETIIFQCYFLTCGCMYIASVISPLSSQLCYQNITAVVAILQRGSGIYSEQRMSWGIIALKIFCANSTVGPTPKTGGTGDTALDVKRKFARNLPKKLFL